MTDLSDRIKSRLQQLRKSARRASIDGGLTPDAIRNVLRAKSLNPRRDTLAGIALGLDWTLETLLDLPSAGTAPPSGTSMKRVPYVSWTQAGDLARSPTLSRLENFAAHVTVEGDASVLLPLLAADLLADGAAPLV